MLSLQNNFWNVQSVSTILPVSLTLCDLDTQGS